MDLHLWNDIMLPGIPIAEKILRPILVYVFLVVGLRLGGRPSNPRTAS
jgi:hypothetical protein